MSDNGSFRFDKTVVIPLIMLFIPGIRWVGVYLLWRKLRQSNVLPGFKTKTFSAGTLCVIIGLVMLLAKFGGFLAFTVLLAGAAGLGVGYLVKQREKNDEKYKTIIGDRAFIRFDTLTGILGCGEKKLIRTLDSMLKRGVLGKSAYMDMGRRMLVLRPDEVMPENIEPEEPAEQAEPERGASGDEYNAFLEKIDYYNRRIKDPTVSRKIDRIHAVAADIFSCVRSDPDKKAKIRSFTNYYLPTTEKILAAYADMEKQSAAGQNILGTKQKIEGILDTLIAAYEQQLDLLFGKQALDISTDIDVLETMMAKDGFTARGTDKNKVELRL